MTRRPAGRRPVEHAQPGPVPVETQRLLHDLEVHQFELQQQNEELCQARRDISVALERYSDLFDFAPIGYAVLTHDGSVQAINHTGARIIGNVQARLLKRRFSSLVTVRDRATFGVLLQDVLHGPGQATCEVELDEESEPRTVVRLTATLLAKAEPTCLLAFVDISDDRRKTAELAQAERALREEDARKDQFLAMLSHELRNPLTPIHASLHLLKQVPPGGAQARKARDVIERQIAHLTHIVDDLLDITRITRGKVHLQRTCLDLALLVQCTVDDHQAAFQELGLQLEAQVKAEPVWVDADPTRLLQAVSNLLGNARKFTPRGGRIDVLLRRVGGRAEVTICDTGTGIAPEMLAQIFDPFTQAPQTLARSLGGLGLGLATVKGLIELHGGTVEVASEGLGRGTLVTLRLPLVSAPTQAALDPAPPQLRRRLVVIEDNRDAAEALEMVLTMHGHEVQVAYDGLNGINLIRLFRPEVVVCDLGLPGMNGYAVAAALRNDRTLGPMFLIALSGYTQEEDVRRALAAGFDVHLAKPPNLEVLYDLISQMPGPESVVARPSAERP
jgi:signal transduction histidine kinase/ActR/RegA family two-component response regulator